MVAFYLLPLLFFKGEKFVLLIKNLFMDKKNYLLILFFFFYLIYLIIFFDFNEELILGNGFIHKISILIFKDPVYKSVFIYFSFFVFLVNIVNLF